MKAIWTGSLSFGLVNISITLHSAIMPHSPGFTLLCDTCFTPITYQRWCSSCDKDVSWQHTVKGLKQPDGNYFILTKENLEQLRPGKKQYINMLQFVPKNEIEIIYLDAHYYVAPAKKNEKEFYLFHQALVNSGLVAIGSFVMHEKEHICAIMPYQEILLLNTLNYAYEIKDAAQLTIDQKKPATTTQELALAEKLIKQFTRKKFDLSQFKDTFKNKLTEMIKAQKKTGKKIAKKIVQKKANDKEAPLLSALRASLHKRPKPTSQSTVYARSKK